MATRKTRHRGLQIRKKVEQTTGQMKQKQWKTGIAGLQKYYERETIFKNLQLKNKVQGREYSLKENLKKKTNHLYLGRGEKHK